MNIDRIKQVAWVGDYNAPTCQDKFFSLLS